MEGRDEGDEGRDRYAGAEPFAGVLLGFVGIWLLISVIFVAFAVSYCSDDHPCEAADRPVILALLLPVLAPPALAFWLSFRAFRSASRRAMDMSQVFTRFCIALGLFVVWWAILGLY